MPSNTFTPSDNAVLDFLGSADSRWRKFGAIQFSARLTRPELEVVLERLRNRGAISWVPPEEHDGDRVYLRRDPRPAPSSLGPESSRAA